MNTAQQLYHAWTNTPDFDGADLAIAAEQTAEQVRAERAPHAYRGTPARPHNVRDYNRKRLFKGHRK